MRKLFERMLNEADPDGLLVCLVFSGLVALSIVCLLIYQVIKMLIGSAA